MTFTPQENILIDNSGNAVLSDFGLLRILQDSTSSSSYECGGTTRWMGPELFNPEGFGLEDASPTKPSDCYALGMTIYEVLSGRLPFFPYRTSIVMMRVLNGERPERLQGAGGVWFTDDVWEILERCWKPKPGDRPSIDYVLQQLEEASSFWAPPSPLMMVEGPQEADSSRESVLTQESVD